jgi:hypothetical protein
MALGKVTDAAYKKPFEHQYSAGWLPKQQQIESVRRKRYIGSDN